MPKELWHTHQSAIRSDRVEISAASASAAGNGVLNDSVVEQINRAIQEAGIDQRVETAGSIDLLPEGTARRISDIATRYFDSYLESRVSQPVEPRIDGFMSLIRGAIEEGFFEARDFLAGITKLSETMRQTIDRTFKLTQGYPSEFRSAQLATTEQPAEGQSTDTERGEEQ